MDAGSVDPCIEIRALSIDRTRSFWTIKMMATKMKSPGIPPKLLAELEEVLADLAAGTRDPEAMKKAARDMDRMREETRKKVGMVDVAALIHEVRDEV